MNTKQKYTLVTNGPVAKFYYKGTHSHPIRRTILVIEENSKMLVGYEIREGKEVRKVRNAPVKSFRKDKIANFGDYCRLKMNNQYYNKLDSDTTLERDDFVDLVMSGV
jgi:hypothetical protein